MAMKVQDNPKGWPEGWLVAAAAAVVAAGLARLVGEAGLFAAVMIAIFVFVVFGVLLGMFWGGPVAQPHRSGPPQGSQSQPQGHAGQGQARAPVAFAASAAAPAAVEPVSLAAAVMSAAPVPVVSAVQHEALVPAALVPVEYGGKPEPMDISFIVEQPFMKRSGTPEAPDTSTGRAVQAAAPVGSVTAADPAPEPVADAVPLSVMSPAEPQNEADDGDNEPFDTDEDAMQDAPRRTKQERVAARAAKATRQAAKAARPKEAIPEPVLEGGNKPQGLAVARGGVADRLQTIEGIGPVLEKLCHDMGIYHFDQIAGWGAAEIAWMDGNLKGFKGRVTRDGWVRQAVLVGEVGVDEFLRRARSNANRAPR